MYEHTLRLTHRREPSFQTLGEAPAESHVEINAGSTDLTTAWQELLSRLPNDVYAGLKAAMAGVDR